MDRAQSWIADIVALELRTQGTCTVGQLNRSGKGACHTETDVGPHWGVLLAQLASRNSKRRDFGNRRLPLAKKPLLRVGVGQNRCPIWNPGKWKHGL